MSDPTESVDVQFSPERIAAMFGPTLPTPEQRAIIVADTDHPHLVVAGAGSGKTETMANRAVYLIANELVQPGEILGLTFTRKAASELDERVNRRLKQFNHAIGRASDNDLRDERPEVSTYNAFAASVYRDHALRIGFEPDAVVITESVAWQLAHRVVTQSTDPRLEHVEIAVGTVVDSVLSLAREMADHGTHADEVRSYAEQVVRHLLPHVESIPQKTKREPVEKYLDNVALLPLFVDLAEQYQAEKRARGFIEFSDQVALAQRILSEFPEVAEIYRRRFKVIILDEYQDTSVAQTRFLATLFRGSAVMAVGDPDQSIYGFRGASAANLSRFADDFGAGKVYPLSISWRNARSILRSANLVANTIQRTPGISKQPLSEHQNTTDGVVELLFEHSIFDEADAVAEWFADRMQQSTETPSAALLLRAKKHFEVFADALRARGIPVHILGLSGLLAEPVIVDLRAELEVIVDSTANAAMLRLLTGARWMLGAADIKALHDVAALVASHDQHGRPLSQEAIRQARHSAEEIDTSSLIEAVDLIASNAVKRTDWLNGFTEAGLARIRSFGAELASLRRRSAMKLTDFVELVSTEMQLDIEAHANPTARNATQALEAFHDIVAGFTALADQATVTELVRWLDDAEGREPFAPQQEPPEPGTVQIMTIHAAKGLEWDLVALPRFVTDEMPSKPKDVSGWLIRGKLPYALRGDATELPQFNWNSVSHPDDVLRALDDFVADVKTAQLHEERRLGYVAVTRPRTALLISGSWWGGQKNSRAAGELLALIAQDHPAYGESWPESEPGTVPPETGGEGVRWPLQPFGDGGRATTVAFAAAQVRTTTASATPQMTKFIHQLIAERDHVDASVNMLPVRIPASRVKAYLENTAATIKEIGRPIPQRPYSATRLGTLFHSWVERRAETVIELDGLESERDESDAIEFDAGAQQQLFDSLKSTFERSPWGGLNPVDVEREIHVPLAGHVFVCKIDAVYAVDETNAAILGVSPKVKFQIVDWKTGAAPVNPADLALKQSQLALYRIAYAKHLGIDPDSIDAVFYFVATNEIVRPTQMHTEAEFVADWLAQVERNVPEP